MSVQRTGIELLFVDPRTPPGQLDVTSSLSKSGRPPTREVTDRACSSTSRSSVDWPPLRPETTCYL